jgi:hypothetical protein
MENIAEKENFFLYPFVPYIVRKRYAIQKETQPTSTVHNSPKELLLEAQVNKIPHYD